MGRALRGVVPAAGGLLKFTATPLAGAFVVDLEPREDERGSFARCYCDDEFAARGLETDWPQMNLSRNTRRGTLRGMHFQAAPHREAKVVRCVRGAVFDVLVDLRPGSPTRLRWYGVELSAANGRALYVPRDFAHGFLTLEDDSELLYLMSSRYVPGAERGFRWDDTEVGIRWPLPVSVIGAKDAAWPPAREAA